jgi:hypothetical protein
MRFQIRDANFGYAIVDAPSGRAALAEFFAARAAGAVNTSAMAFPDGSATVVSGGSTFTAVPVDPAPEGG